MKNRVCTPDRLVEKLVEITYRKKVKKGIDFIEKLRYNWYLRELECRIGGVIHAQH